jgi:predicted dehydrogenase
MISVGLVGFGVSGRVFHAPVIGAVSGLRLTGIVQRHGDSARRACPDVRIHRDLDSLLADDSIRLVVIATPNAAHHELARRCLLAGRDVVADKPLTVTSAEARGLAELAAARGRVLSVYQNRRWDGDFLTVERLIRSGALGRVVIFESRYDRYRAARRVEAWRESQGPGAGVLYDLGPHLLDQAMVLFGMPQAITADVRIERADAVVDDAFDILLGYPGLRVFLRATMLACSPAPRFLVYGAGGSFSKHGMDPQESVLRAGGSPASPGWGEEDETRWGTLACRGEDGSIVRRTVPTERGDYRRFYENVRDAIDGVAGLAVTAEHSAEIVRLIELARQSSAQRRTLDCPV